MGQFPPKKPQTNLFLCKIKRDPLSLGGGICSHISVKGLFQQQMMFERFYVGKFSFQLKLRRLVSWVEMTATVLKTDEVRNEEVDRHMWENTKVPAVSTVQLQKHQTASTVQERMQGFIPQTSDKIINRRVRIQILLKSTDFMKQASELTPPNELANQKTVCWYDEKHSEPK